MRCRQIFLILVLTALMPSLLVHGQRSDRKPSQDLPAPKAKKKPAAPAPRAVAVLEWVPSKPDAGVKVAPDKDDPPKQARVIPISIFYQGAYQDAGVFLSQPTPLALQADTVYELQHAGDAAGTFTLHTAARVRDSWVAYGDFKPEPPPKPFKPNVNIALGASSDDEEGDRPVLKRRHPDAESTGAGTSTTTVAGTKPPTSQAPAGPVGSDDPDRPTLKRHDTAATPDATAKTTAPTGSDDPGRPTLHARPDSAKSGVADLKTSDDYLNPADDPSRPRIRRGTYEEQNPALPSVLGNPADLRQTVAVSDAVRASDHAFVHGWNDEAEKSRAQQAMQQLALTQIAKWRQSQGVSAMATPAAPAKPAAAGPHSRPATAARAKRKVAVTTDFTAIQFAAYDLSYQDEPTYVYAAQTTATGAAQVFVAVVARPDIYGALQVEFSAVTSEAQLGITPRYRLVDAVDANGDGRAELLLQSDNEEGRRFMLLDIYRGEASKVFETALLP